MTDTIQDRLRGIYRIPITDGLGPAGGEEPNNPNEFVRDFSAFTPPIQAEAAAHIDAQDAKIKALVEALSASVATIEDYIAYEHDGDPWTEDARAMREMDIDDYATDGRLDKAKGLIAAAKETT